MSTGILPALREVQAELESLGLVSARIERALAKERQMHGVYYLFMFATDDGRMPTVAIKWSGSMSYMLAYQALLRAGVLEIDDEIEHVDCRNLEDFEVDEAIAHMQECYWEIKAHEEQSQ